MHRTAVDDAVRGYSPNVILGGYPPPCPQVHPSEMQLPREARTTLCQLRSGYCKRLNDYWARIRPGVANICPACHGSPHNVAHLFDCPTDLEIIDLWEQPVEVARFLDLPVDDLAN